MAEGRRLEKGKRFTLASGPGGKQRVFDAELGVPLKDCDTKQEANDWVRILNGRDARGEYDFPDGRAKPVGPG